MVFSFLRLFVLADGSVLSSFALFMDVIAFFLIEYKRFSSVLPLMPRGIRVIDMIGFLREEIVNARVEDGSSEEYLISQQI
jgi:hypothetical protein